MSQGPPSLSDPIETQEVAPHNQELLRLVVESVHDLAIYELDPQGNISLWNAGAERLKGYKAEEIVGKHFSCFYSPEEAAAVKPQRDLEAAARDGRFEEESWRVRKDGSKFWADVITTALWDETGRLRGFGRVTRDITGHKQAQQAQRDLSGWLLHLQDEQHKRIARDLHDITGPMLSGVLMNLSVVGKEADRLDKGARAALEESEMLARRVVQEMRALAYQLHPPLLDYIGLAPALRWLVDDFAGRSRIKGQLDIPADLPRLPYPIQLGIFRIVQECLTNIQRHADSPDLIVRLFADGGKVITEVTDHGHGVPRGAREGTGLQGVRQRVQCFGGEMEIHSGRDGTTVQVSLPVEAGDQAQRTGAQAREPKSGAAGAR